MQKTCILTDNSVQFPQHAFPGRKCVHIIPLKIRVNHKIIENGGEYKVSNLPLYTRDGFTTELTPPSVDEFQEQFMELSVNYNEAVAIFLSSHLNSAVENASIAADLVRGKIAIQVIDSQTVSAGLGMLVQVAAEAVDQGIHLNDIEHKIRGLIPHVYSLFCIQGLSYLAQAGFIGHAQAEIGQMLSLLPVFTFEEGRIVSLEKVKNIRNLMEYYLEFIDEFSDLYQISLIQSYPTNTSETHILRDHVLMNFPKTPFSEHPINLPLAALFGPSTVGIITMETQSDNHF
jgi:DegV family protein with EDD domain